MVPLLGIGLLSSPSVRYANTCTATATLSMGLRRRAFLGASPDLVGRRLEQAGVRDVESEDARRVAAQDEIHIVLGDPQPGQLAQAPPPVVDLVVRDPLVAQLHRVARRLAPELRVDLHARAPVGPPQQLARPDVRVDERALVELAPPQPGL